MFKQRNQTDTLALVAAIGTMGQVASAAVNAKGAGAERMEAMAQVVAALGFDAQSIKTVEIGWDKLRIDGSTELVPVLKMTAVDDTVQTIVQTER